MSDKKLPKRYGWNTPATAPGPSGKTMLTSMRNIMANPLPFLMATKLQFGNVAQFPIPVPATYFVSSPDGAREILAMKYKSTNKRTIQYSTLSLVTGEGLLTADGDAWKERRRLLQPAFHTEMIELTKREVISGLERLNDRWNKIVETSDGVVDIDQEMMTLALEITGNTLFGTDLSDEAEEITHATIQALQGVIARAQNPLALPLNIPTPGNKSMRSAIARLDQAIARILKLNESNQLAQGAPIRNMLDVLLVEQAHGTLNPTQVRDEIATFIVAGHETIASALTWSIHLLGQNPDEQEKLHNDPSRSEMVFNETLRLYPPAWVITRRTTEDVEIDGVSIPNNSLVIMSPWVSQRSEKVYEKPLEFNPERMKDGPPLIGFLPFGAGPRICIGRDVALLEGKLIVADIFKNWQITPLHNEEVAVDASVTLRPLHGLPMRIARR